MLANTPVLQRITGLALLLIGLAAGVAQAAEMPVRSGFDHMQTGFPLLGMHAQTDCQTCHLQGVFKGTPRQCEACHTQGSRVASTFKPHNHPQTAMPCNQCHVSQMSWSGARFDHLGIAPGRCAGCHNGVTATGKSARHLLTTASCDACHRTTAWTPAGYNHAGVLPGTCTSCHGVTATGKPGGHIATTLECDQCHTTRNWNTAGFNHTGVAPGSCEALCHRTGGGATPRPGGSHPATGSCDVCHTTRNWNTAGFSHSAAVAGQCNTCHGVTATGKNARHIPTNLSCDACHTYTQPFSSNSFAHRANQDVVPTQCGTCHTGYGKGTYDGAKGRKNDAAHHQADHDICDTCHTTRNWDPIRGNRAPLHRSTKKR